jgi:membrane protein implicated in regulation of membrane protease activity
MLATLPLYAIVLGLIAVQRAPFSGFAPSLPMGLLRVVFAVAALVDLVLLRVVTRQLISARPTVQPFRGASLVGQRLFTLSIVRLAICEAIAVFGVVLFLLGGRWADFYGFAVVSFAVLLFHFPRLSPWEDWARQLPA